MGKTILLGLLFVLAMTIAMTTSFVDLPPAAQSAVVEKSPPTISNHKESSSSEESSDDDDHDASEDSAESVDDKEQMLCNVIVRATYDLHVHQSKSSNEIITYLNTDCENLGTEELIEQCREIVAQYGTKIYAHVTDGMEMSQICKKIEDQDEMDLDEERTTECSHEGGNKCQCCKMHVEKRKMRLRYVVKKIARKRMCMCKESRRPYRCRQWIRRKEQRVLKRIEKICPRAICKHLGYCKELIEEDNSASKLLMASKVHTADDSPSLWLELLDQQLEAYFTKDVCSEFKQLQALCIHLAASIDSRRYAKLYMAMLHNDTTWIDNDIRAVIQSSQAGSNADLCGACKNVVQSSTTFYLQSLDTVRNAFVSICEQSQVKDKCDEFFNKRLDTIKVYLHSSTPNKFCSAVQRCSSSSVTNDKECTTCVQRLQPRKDAAIQAVNRLSVYFTGLCAKASFPECQQFVSEVVTEARSFIDEFDVEEMCQTMGFCGQNAVHDIDSYEQAFVEQIGKQVCSTLGPFEALCQQVVRGDSNQVQTVSLKAASIDDFFGSCEEEADGENAVVATIDQCAQDKDKCRCCINKVIQKKKCLKKRVAKYVWHMSQLCKKCPAQEKCEQYWQKKKACWDAKIDKICPKKVCIHKGYCTKAELPSMCTYMGPFKQVCKQALSTVGQLFGEEHEQSDAMTVGHVSVQSKDKNEKQSAANKP